MDAEECRLGKPGQINRRCTRMNADWKNLFKLTTEGEELVEKAIVRGSAGERLLVQPGRFGLRIINRILRNQAGARAGLGR